MSRIYQVKFEDGKKALLTCESFEEALEAAARIFPTRSVTSIKIVDLILV